MAESLANTGASVSINITPGNALLMNNKALMMEANERWPFPAHKDGWMHAHNALRRDMGAILSAFEVLLKQVDADVPLSAWQISAVTKYWQHFTMALMSHHDNEEAIFFPWIETRVRLPLLWSEEHGTQVELLNECDDAIGALRVTNDAKQDVTLVESFMGPYTQFKQEVEPHLRHEEEGLPLLRQHFTFEECKQPLAAMAEHRSAAEVAGFYHAMTDADRQEFFVLHQIPRLHQLLFIMPAVKKFDRKIFKPLQAAISGSQGPARGSKIGSTCFGVCALAALCACNTCGACDCDC